MRATGIIRRIDDLGRVVIPREIRRALCIEEGDPLEVYTSKDGEVIFRPYRQLFDVIDNLDRIIDNIEEDSCQDMAIKAIIKQARENIATLDRRDN